MKESRFEKAVQYLVDLLRAYGDRPIIVNINMEGDVIEVNAYDYIRQAIFKSGIKFPFAEVNVPNTRKVNDALDIDMLSVIFFKAIFELEQAYVEERSMGRRRLPVSLSTISYWVKKKQEWLDCTFPSYNDNELVPFPKKKKVISDQSNKDQAVQEAKEALSWLNSIDKIETDEDFNRVFWEMAMHHRPVTKELRDKLRDLMPNDDVFAAFNKNLHQYNRFLQEKIEADTLEDENYKIRELNKQHQEEMSAQKRAYKEAVAELNRKHQADLHDKLSKSKEKIAVYKAVVKKFRTLVYNPLGKIQQTYDLTEKEDIRDFISWFKVEHRKVRNQLVKNIEKRRYADNPEALDLFKKMVEEYNSSLLNEIDDEDDEIEEVTE